MAALDNQGNIIYGQPFNPWAGGTIVNNQPPQFAPGYGAIYSTPAPTGLPAGARLSSVSVQGYRLAKLLQRPSFIREREPYREWFTGDGEQRITRTFDVPFSGRLTAVDYFLGASYSVPETTTFGGFNQGSFPTTTQTGNANIVRILPDQVPTHPHLWASACEVEGWGAYVNDPNCKTADGEQVPMITFISTNGGQPDVDGVARISVTYTPRMYELLSDAEAAATGYGELSRYVDRQITYAVQAQQIPSTIQFKFIEGPAANTVVPMNPVLIIPLKQLQYRWVDVPDIPHTSIDACLGKVNDAEFDGAPGWPAYPAGTLLCQPPKTRRYRTFYGRTLWEITYCFDYRPNGWNKFLAASPATARGNYYLAAQEGDSTKPLFASADFSSLFRL